MGLRIATETLAYDRMPAALYRVSYFRMEPQGSKMRKAGYTCYFDTEEAAIEELSRVAGKQGFDGRIDRYIMKENIVRHEVEGGEA